jgi:hypothetical protein
MAIKIAPKKIEAFEESPWISIAFSFSLVILLITTLAILFLFALTNRTKDNIKNLDQLLKASQTEKEIILETKVKKYQQKLKDIVPLIRNHRYYTRFFNNLQDSTHPQVMFSALKLKAKTGFAQLIGFTENLTTLSQQQKIFQENQFLKSAYLNNTSLTKEGKIEFNISLILDKKALVDF